MKKTIALQIEKLPEGVFLATSRDIQGLVVQEDTVAKTIASAREVAKMLLGMEAGAKRESAQVDVVVRMPRGIPLFTF